MSPVQGTRWTTRARVAGEGCAFGPKGSATPRLEYDIFWGVWKLFLIFLSVRGVGGPL